MALKLRLSQKQLLLISLPLVCEIVCVAGLALMLKQSDQETAQLEHSKQLITSCNELTREAEETVFAIMCWKATSIRHYDEQYRKLVEELPKLATKLQTLTAFNPSESKKAASLAMYSQSVIEMTKNIDKLENDANILLTPEMREYQFNLELLRSRMLAVQDSLAAEERHSLPIDRTVSTQKHELIYQAMSTIIVVNILLSLLLAFYSSRFITRRLGVLNENAILLASRKPLNAQLSGRDEIAELDRVFHSMAEELTRAEQSKQEFVAMISHDLRTPLTSLELTLGLLGKDDGSEAAREKSKSRLANAQRSARRIIKLVNELLDLDKIEAGMLELDLDKTDIKSMLERSLDTVNEYAAQSGVTLYLDAPPCEAVVDGDRLGQVVVNLVSNAIKFSPKGSAIKISLQQTRAWLTVKVTDQGKGIPSAHSKKIFDRFEQVDKDDSRRGTGLGLAICKALVEAHNGEIGVVSEEGVGSTFWFKVPANRGIS